MATKEIRAKIYSKIDELPTLPAVLPKILSLIESNRSSASDIADAISSDPAMTSKILKVANSAYYGFSQKVASIGGSSAWFQHGQVPGTIHRRYS